MARARLLQMPRNVYCRETARKHELRVLWDSVDSHRNEHKPVKIVLHEDGDEDSLYNGSTRAASHLVTEFTGTEGDSNETDNTCSSSVIGTTHMSKPSTAVITRDEGAQTDVVALHAGELHGQFTCSLSGPILTS